MSAHGLQQRTGALALEEVGQIEMHTYFWLVSAQGFQLCTGALALKEVGQIKICTHNFGWCLHMPCSCAQVLWR